jgi:hypothetical protein
LRLCDLPMLEHTLALTMKITDVRVRY